MRRAAIALFAILVVAGFFAFRSARAVQPRAPELGVLRTSPAADEPAEPGADITVTFDRPVAGGLEDLVDAGKIFRISPSVRGKAEWRDPVTLRFTPGEPLEPGTEYRVTVANTFSAMDGGRLPKPHEFTFRVARAHVITGDPVGPNGDARFLPPRPTFRVLLSSSFDADELDSARVEPDTSCHGGTPVRLRLAGQHPIGRDDPEWFRYYGDAGGDSTRDLRRVAELTPERPLLPGCKAELVLPARLDSVGGTMLYWGFSTYGPLSVVYAGCPYGGSPCHYGPATIVFSTPVRGAEVLRHVRVAGRRFTVRDTAQSSDVWPLEGRLDPRRAYTITVDAGLADVFGQRLPAAERVAFTTPGVPPSVVYPHGKMIVERQGFGTLAVQHVNVDTLVVTVASVPERMEARFLSRGWGWSDAWTALEPGAEVRRIPVVNRQDASAVTGVRLAAGDATRQRGGTLLAVRVGGRGVDTATAESGGQPVALVQVTDLAVHARVGLDQAVVWVTGVNDGLARNGVEVQLHDTSGAVRASGRTDARGLAVLSGFGATRPAVQGPEECESYCGGSSFEGYVSAQDGADRAVVGVNEYDPDLSPYEFGVYGAWGEDRAPTAGAVFTERGIYRPGEPVYAKAIVRRGPLGALLPPGPGDSLKWIFRDREGKAQRDTTVSLSRFGTAEQGFRLPMDVPLGQYGVEIQARRDGRWRPLGYTSYQVAEYRPPEFLVDATAPKEAKFAGDDVPVTIGGRYLFGAPMAHAPLRWTARQVDVSPWAVNIPGTDGYQLGEEPNWWSDEAYNANETTSSGVDTLDAKGYRDLKVKAAPQGSGRPAMLTVAAEVVDANRQTVAASTSLMVHPADFYLGAKPQGKGYFWSAGVPVRVDVIAVRPDGHNVAGVSVEGTVARREWHYVRRMRNGVYDEVGEWVTDTVARCRMTTGSAPAPCAFTPREGGDYTVTFATRDRKGRSVRTSFTRWVVGPGWVPWNDSGKFRMEVVPDRQKYAVGDTATILLAAPFTNAEAWVTVERERVLQQFRIRITSGTQTVKIPITEALAPNAFVSVVMVRGRSARPGTVDDPGRPTLRVGYAELKVTPEIKRLAVTVQPLRPEYRPGDTARVRVRLRDAAGRPQVGEVTVWAVDEGVLSLTGYQTPDPIDLIYQPRGLGMRLASNLVSVAPQVPEGQKGARNPGGSGGRDGVGVLRSTFRPTAFFIGSVVTDANGEAVVAGKLPDNITTFRVMALAVTAGDRYGSGHAPLLATRPLLARPSLPRFLREGDDFMAGVVVNHRFPGGVGATVSARANGVRLLDDRSQTLTLGAGRGAEALFHFHAIAGDTARFRFDAAGNGAADAVQVGIPIHPANRPVTQAVAGVLRDTATVEWELPAETDLSRSRLILGFGTSPLALVQAYQRWLEIYPYECTEQVSSAGLPLITLYRAQRASGARLLKGDARPGIETVIRTISARQREDGGIGLWSETDWTTPWLTAYAGRVLLDAREAGFTVQDTVLNGIAGYLTRALRDTDAIRRSLSRRDLRMGELLTERLAAADFLSRMGRPDIPSENLLLGQASRMAWEDRVALAEVLARRGAREPALRLLDAAWATVRVRGTRAYLPANAYERAFYFASSVRPAARLLTATLELRPDHPMLGALVETVVEQGRDDAALEWTTQDYGSAILALARFDRAQRGAVDRMVTVRQGNRVVARMRARRGQTPDSTAALTGLVTTRWDGRKILRVQVRAEGAGPAVFYTLAVREVTGRATYRPLDRGISVERWYETVDTRRPVTSVAAGQVVRVRLRVTVPEDRSMVVLDDPLPAGLEAVDLSLRTVSPFAGDLLAPKTEGEEEEDPFAHGGWYWGFGSWDAGMWSAFDHTEIRDDRVVYFARRLWRGSYSATYLARATTAGRFVSAPAQAEEMYNPGVHGRSGGGLFTVRPAGD